MHGFTDEFKVPGYTTFKVNDKPSANSMKLYANEYMNGEKRNHFVRAEAKLLPQPHCRHDACCAAATAATAATAAAELLPPPLH